ncbi:TetR/AcrR family transcriptional regulator [Kordiimonas sp.]|uniref:TetR/AcrR family transcriptional regulator n=1 Tax=Kordiimonas sp. TaxID=1970157 RepID=UPI003A951627
MSASKRDELVAKAQDIFYREGFHATGMDRLVAETGISKTSMYNHFRTKEDLILATLQHRHNELHAQLMARTEELAKTPKERILASFDSLKEWIESGEFRSCMFIKASSEYQDPTHPIHIAAAEHKRSGLRYLAALAEAAGAKEPEVLATQLMLLKEGAIVSAHLEGHAGMIEAAKAAAHTLVETAVAAARL